MTVYATHHPCYIRQASHLERAGVLYQRFRDRGRRAQFVDSLLGRSRSLLRLDQVCQAGPAEGRRHAGIVTVPISQIRGSEDRVADYSQGFYPLNRNVRQRWTLIAAARLQGKRLPPVSLIQVGDVYFVRDGHHRLSVAVALGEAHIEARVLVWETVPAPSIAAQKEPAVHGSRLRGLVQQAYARRQRRPVRAIPRTASAT